MPTITTLDELEDLLTYDCVFDIAQQGSNDNTVDSWIDLVPFIITKQKAIEALKPYGCWSDSELCREKLVVLKSRMLWLAAWNVKENNYEWQQV